MDVSERRWNGVALSVAQFQFDGEIILPLPYQNRARLGVILEELGGPCEARLKAHTSCPVPHMPKCMHFTPADMPCWGHTKNARHVIDATLVFDFDALSERLALRIDADRIDMPQVRFANDRVWSLVKLLSEVVDNPDPSTQLFGDGIVTAITSQLFAAAHAVPATTGRLAPWQLRRVTDYMESHFPERIELATLAAQINLSQAHFSRAFKASTGVAPYQWQLNSRLQRAQCLLADTDAALGEVAQMTGFADTVHFGKAFRRHVGAAPGAWRSEHKR